MIIKKDKQITKHWSGGTTTELLIMPKTSDYKLNNFDFRLSTARVENTYSEFTKLPGVRRYIMSLTESFMIAHNGQWENLEPFESHSFDGGVITKSKGTFIDFNLMTRKEYTGSLTRKVLLEDEIFEAMYVYMLKGCIELDGEYLYEMDFFHGENKIHSFKVVEDAEVIIIEVYKP